MWSLFLLFATLEPASGALNSYIQLLFLNRGFSQSLVGLVLGLSGIAQVAVPLVLCAFAEKHKAEKHVLIFCMTAGALLFVPIAISGSDYVSIVCFYILQGLFWTSISLADGYSNKCLGNHREKFAGIRAVGSLSYVVFMILFAVTGFPNSSDNRQIMINFVYISLLTALSVALTKGYCVESPEKEEKVSKFIDLKWFDSKFYMFMSIVSVSRIAMCVIDRFLFSYIKVNLGQGDRFTYFVALGASAEIAVMILSQKLLDAKKLDSLSLLRLSCLGIFVRLLIYSVTENVIIFAITQVLHGLCYGACQIAVTDYVAKNVAPEHTSMAMTFYWCVGTNLPQIFGSFFCGIAIDRIGYNSMFAVYSLTGIVALMMSFLFGKKIRQGNT